MKDIVKIAERQKKLKTEAIVNALIIHILIAVGGFITARGVVMDKLLPFGISFLAGASLTYTPAAAIGVFFGYFVPALGSGGFRYIAAMFAVLTIKLLLSNYKKLAEGSVFLSFITLLSSFFTSAVTLNGINFAFLTVIAEAVLAAGGTFFVCKCYKAMKNAASGLLPDELAALYITVSMLLVGINGIADGGISLGGIIGIAVILLSAKYGGILSGTVSGTAISLALLLGGVSGDIAVIYAFVGLVAGLFSSWGKYIEVAIPLIFSLVGSVSTGNPLVIASTVIEAALGSALFLAVPRKVGIYISKIFAVRAKTAAADSFKKSLTMRLQVAANALSDVSETVEQVSGELSKINSPDFGTVISAIEQDACLGCKLRVHCWENRRDSTVSAILEMTKAIKEGSSTPENNAPEEFKGRCLRVSGISNSVYKRYSNYVSKIAAENRIDEVRELVSDQFDGISYLLSEFAEDLEKDAIFDNALALKAATALKNLNILCDECSSVTDKYGRVCIELRVKKEPELIINKLQVMKLISVVCERDFGVPILNETDEYIYVTLNEHPAIRVEVGIEQKCALDTAMCGDAYKYFFDGKGHFIMILSDGMGTGGRAAVDGAMASGLMSRLLKAGFPFDSALKILNSSMLFKSTDESLATVDIASIDLYTGKVELYKAGAAPTLIRRSGRTGRATSSSLPAGILRDIGFDKAMIRCKIGDIVVMMSDGAATEGTEWIKDELEGWTDGTAEELATRICEGAKRRRTDNHEDDITVMTAILKKSV